MCPRDGLRRTLAHDGSVNGATLSALRKLKEAHFRLILVTGRSSTNCRQFSPQITWFDLAVMENGAVLFHPHTGEIEALAPPPPSEFVARLHERGLPLQIGKSIVATWEPHENIVLQTIKEMGLELQVIFNKGSVMILPSGVNKATGLRAAAERLSLTPSKWSGLATRRTITRFSRFAGIPWRWPTRFLRFARRWIL
ncbi:MAG: HAD hydrolase family protein [Chthoniobacter sp.]